MGMAQLVVTAVLVEGRTKSEVAREYGVSRRWVITLVQRYLAEGDAGLDPRSRRPLTSPQTHRPGGRGRDRRHPQGARPGRARGRRRDDRVPPAAAPRQHAPAVSTIWRILSRRGFVTPQPHKRPKSSYLRFAAEQPNERWQLDITHWALADGTDVEILNLHRRPLPAAASPATPGACSKPPTSTAGFRDAAQPLR